MANPRRSFASETWWGLKYIVSHILQRLVLTPYRRRAYRNQARPFVFQSPDGTLFELIPGELIDQQIATYGYFDIRDLDFISSLIPHGSVMIDIGANIGNHALYFRRKCRSVHCFEPNPTAWRRLLRNIELNEAKNIQVHTFGLGDRDMLVPFHEDSSGNLGGSRFITDSNRLPGDESCERLPELMVRHAGNAIEELCLDRIDLIKIDVEGMEGAVFEGLRETIRTFRPIIAFEYHGQASPIDRFHKILSTLQDYSVAEARFDWDDRGPVTKAFIAVGHRGVPSLWRVHVPQPRLYESLLAIPKESRWSSAIRDDSPPDTITAVDGGERSSKQLA